MFLRFLRLAVRYPRSRTVLSLILSSLSLSRRLSCKSQRAQRSSYRFPSVVIYEPAMLFTHLVEYLHFYLGTLHPGLWPAMFLSIRSV